MGLTDIKRKLQSKKNGDVYDACVEIRKKVMKSPQGIRRLVKEDVLPILLDMLKQTPVEQGKQTEAATPEDPYRTKINDVICSILGNICMDATAREEVLKHGGISILGNLLSMTTVESIQNRCCRCLANICLSSKAWKLVHESEVPEKIVKLLKESQNPECQQTYIRALRLLGQTPHLVQKLLDKHAVCAVMQYVDSEQEPVARSVLTFVSHLLTRRNTDYFASQVVSSGKLSHLISVAKATNTPQDALMILIDLSEHYNFRPAFGNAGGISFFVNLLKTENFSGKEKVLSVLCLCCKEAVNRVKLREEGALILLVKFLKDKTFRNVHSRIISALVCFIYDETSFELLLCFGLVDVLVNHLKQYFGKAMLTESQEDSQHGLVESWLSGLGEASSEKKDQKIDGLSNLNCMEVPVTQGKSTIGLSTATETTQDIHSKADGEENKRKERDDSEQMEAKELNRPDFSEEIVHVSGYYENQSKTDGEIANIEEMTDNEHIAMEDKQNIGSDDPLLLSVACEGDAKPTGSKNERLYSIDSPTYQVQTEDFSAYSSGAKCKTSFSPPSYLDTSGKVYSPISNVSYYSPDKKSPDCSPQSDRSISPEETVPLYSYCGLGSPYDETVSSPESGTNKSPSPKYSTDYEKESLTWSPGGSQDCPQENLDSSQNSLKNIKEVEITSLTVTEKVSNVQELCELKQKINDKEKLMEKTSGIGKDREGSLVVESSGSEQLPSHKIRRKRKRSDPTTENNILILMSRVSYITNPTKYIVTRDTIECLLDYIVEIESPFTRAARLLSRVFRNPSCFQKLIRLKIPIIIYQKLLQNENVAVVVKRIRQRLEKETKVGLLRSDSISTFCSSDSDRLSLFEEKSCDECSPAKRQRGSDSSGINLREVRGTIHNQLLEVCDAGKCGLSFLEDLSSVAESPYGKGILKRFLMKDDDVQESVCLSLLYMCRNQGFINYYSKLAVFNNIFTVLREKQPSRFKTIVQGFSLLAHLMNFKVRFQSEKEKVYSEYSVEKTDNQETGSGSEVSEEKSANQDTGSEVPLEKSVYSINSQVILKTEEALSHDVDKEKVEISEEQLMDNSCEGCNLSVTSCHLHSSHTCMVKDVTFVVKGENFSGNRDTLTKSSELFAAMLEGNYSESSLSEISLQETSRFAFTYILHYLHGCEFKECDIRNSLHNEVTLKSSRRLIRVLEEADKYLLHDLKLELQNLMFEKYANPETALNIFTYAVIYDNVRIRKAAVSCVLVDASSSHQLLGQFWKFLDSEFSEIFLKTLMEMILD